MDRMCIFGKSCPKCILGCSCRTTKTKSGFVCARGCLRTRLCLRASLILSHPCLHRKYYLASNRISHLLQINTNNNLFLQIQTTASQIHARTEVPVKITSMAINAHARAATKERTVKRVCSTLK